MANICENTFYAQCSPKNIKIIEKFFEDWTGSIESDEDCIDVYFDSKWDFPESEMNKLFNLLDKEDDIYMRCLSVEYGNDYVAYWKCDNDGWTQIV